MDAYGRELSSEWTLRDASGAVLRRFLKSADGKWSWDQDYIYLDGRMLAAETAGPHRTLHFHLDHLGTPHLITNHTGAVVSEHAYFPFGEEATSTTQHSEKKKFTGHERDSVGQDYMHARYYTGYWGRFLSVDPVMSSADPQFPQSWNRYTYALNNPLKYIDPTGENATVACDPDNNCIATVEAQIVADPNDPAQMAAAVDFRNEATNYWQGRQETGTTARTSLSK